jgi:hypothetical protein
VISGKHHGHDEDGIERRYDDEDCFNICSSVENPW